jgi:hypothetical protein
VKKLEPVPHEVTLVAWMRNPDNTLSILDIVATSNCFREEFIAQFKTYEGIYGYSQLPPQSPITSDNVFRF